MNPPTEPKKKSPALALLLAFLPAAMLMLLGAMNLGQNPEKSLCMTACLLSVVCCFISSFMLFARRTGLAIAVGVLFLILNGLIAFFMGCVALHGFM
jgi:hypothetical protein